MPENHLIQIKYVQQNQIHQSLSELVVQNSTPLLFLEHSQNLTQLTSAEHQLIHLQSGLKSVGNGQQSDWCELWFAKGHWQQDHFDNSQGIQISHYQNDDVLLGSLSIQLTDVSSMQEISQMYYQQLIDFIAQQNKPHLIRMWNYVPDIHRSEDGLERYQQFCVGRHNAFANGPGYPAASAVGSHSSEMIILFIAARQPGIFIENPEQVSAYQYPCEYSPKSPSFARASLYQEQGLKQFYISGTASIVGHESQFINDILGQTKQTLKNLKTLIQYANKQEQLAIDFDPHGGLNNSQTIKVYLRKSDDFLKVAPLIQKFAPNCQNICFLQADICRRDLDIEIEMLCNSRL